MGALALSTHKPWALSTRPLSPSSRPQDSALEGKEGKEAGRTHLLLLPAPPRRQQGSGVMIGEQEGSGSPSLAVLLQEPSHPSKSLSHPSRRVAATQRLCLPLDSGCQPSAAPHRPLLDAALCRAWLATARTGLLLSVSPPRPTLGQLWGSQKSWNREQHPYFFLHLIVNLNLYHIG